MKTGATVRLSDLIRGAVRRQIALAAVVVLALAGCPGGETTTQTSSCTETKTGVDGEEVEVASDYALENPDECKTDSDADSDGSSSDDASGDAGSDDASPDDASPDDASSDDGGTDDPVGGDATDEAAFSAPANQAQTQTNSQTQTQAETQTQTQTQTQTPSQQPATQTPATPKPTPTTKRPAGTTEKPTGTTMKPTTTTTTTMKPTTTTTTTMKPTTTTTAKPVTIKNSEWVMDLRPDPSSSGNSGKYNVRFQVDDGVVSGGQYESNLEATLLFSGTINPDGSTKDLKALAGNNNNPTQKGTYYFDPAMLKTPGDPKTIEGRYRREIGNTTYTGSVTFTKRN